MSNYKWFQNPGVVIVSLGVPDATKKGDIEVIFGPSSVKAGLRGNPSFEGTLSSPIKPPGCKWNLKDNTLFILLEKQNKTKWTEIFKGEDDKKKVKVLYDYDASDAGELTVKEGDVIFVLKEDPSGWWKGEINGKVGLFPSNFIEEMESGPKSPPAEDEPIEFPEDEEDNSQTSHGESNEEQEVEKPKRGFGIPMPGLGGEMSELRNKLNKRAEGSGGGGASIDEQMRQKKEVPMKPAAPMVSLKKAEVPAKTPELPVKVAPGLPPKQIPGGGRGMPPPGGVPMPGAGPGLPVKPSGMPPGGIPTGGANPPMKQGFPPLKKALPGMALPGMAPASASEGAPVKSSPIPSKVAPALPRKESTTTPPTKESAVSPPIEQAKKPIEKSAPAALPIKIPPKEVDSPVGSDDEASDEGSSLILKKKKKEPRPRCKGAYDYAAAADGELSFAEDDIIFIRLRDDSGWWQGELADGTVGWFPANFVEEIEPEEDEEESVEDKLGELVSDAPRLTTPRRSSGPGRRNPTMKKSRAKKDVEIQEHPVEEPAKVPEKTVPPRSQPQQPQPARPIPGKIEEHEPKLPPKLAPKPGLKPPAESEPPKPKGSFMASAKGAIRQAISEGNSRWPSNLPPFEEFCKELQSIFEESKACKTGSISSHFPFLSSVDPETFGFSICTVDGTQFSHGDNYFFSLQGLAWTFTYAFALDELGESKVFSVVGNEPSQAPPHACILNNAKKPHNPFINSGALVVSSLIQSKKDNVLRIQNILDQFSTMTSKRIGCSMPTYISMSDSSSQEASDRDFMMAYWLRSTGAIPKDTDVKKLLDFYFQICSIESNCTSAAVMAATLANEGMNPNQGKRVIDPKNAKATVSLMSTCGLNDATKEWNDTIGIPARTGVSGGTILVIPKVCGICIFSPRLDPKGTSTRCQEFTKLLSQKFPSLKSFRF